jgi:hypothetical protein
VIPVLCKEIDTMAEMMVNRKDTAGLFRGPVGTQRQSFPSGFAPRSSTSLGESGLAFVLVWAGTRGAT